MIYPYLSVKERKSKPILEVCFDNCLLDFPLTKKGCIQAGRYLWSINTERWQYASSVDFPQTVKPRCKLDIRELIDQGFNQEKTKSEAAHKSVTRKIIDLAAKDDQFLMALSADEYTAWEKICKNYL